MATIFSGGWGGDGLKHIQGIVSPHWIPIVVDIVPVQWQNPFYWIHLQNPDVTQTSVTYEHDISVFL